MNETERVRDFATYLPLVLYTKIIRILYDYIYNLAVSDFVWAKLRRVTRSDERREEERKELRRMIT